jgi:hypothetical protein
VLGVLGLALGIFVFTRINKSVLNGFLEADRKIATDAVEARKKLLDAFLAELRSRDLAQKKALEELMRKISLDNESMNEAVRDMRVRVRLWDEERWPKLEDRVRNLEGQVEALQHPKTR